MADDLTADDFRRRVAELTEDVACLCMVFVSDEDADLARRVVPDVRQALSDGWRLTPPLQPGTVTVNAHSALVLLHPDRYSENAVQNARKRFAAALAEASRDH